MRTKTPVGNTNIVELSKVLANFHTSQDVFNFLHDIATPQEIETLAQRFQIAAHPRNAYENATHRRTRQTRWPAERLNW